MSADCAAPAGDLTVLAVSDRSVRRTRATSAANSSDDWKSAGRPLAFSEEESIHWLRAAQMLRRWAWSSMTTKRRKQRPEARRVGFFRAKRHDKIRALPEQCFPMKLRHRTQLPSFARLSPHQAWRTP